MMNNKIICWTGFYLSLLLLVCCTSLVRPCLCDIGHLSVYPEAVCSQATAGPTVNVPSLCVCKLRCFASLDCAGGSAVPRGDGSYDCYLAATAADCTSTPSTASFYFMRAISTTDGAGQYKIVSGDFRDGSLAALKQACASEGLELAVLGSAQDSQYIADNHDSDCWLGLNKVADGWLFSDGTLLSATDTEMHGDGEKKECSIIKSDGSIHAKECSETSGCVVCR